MVDLVHKELAPGTDVVLEGLSRRDLSDEEYRSLQRLALVTTVPGRRVLVLRCRPFQVVGRIRIGRYVVSVPPPISPRRFVAMLLFASGVELGDLLRRPTVTAEAAAAPPDDVFVYFLSALMVDAAESALRQHLAKAYEVRDTRLLTLRGSPDWTRQFGRHPAEGIFCRYHELATDNLVNRLVLAGLVRAQAYLAGTPLEPHASNQVFIWSSIATRSAPNRNDFAVALARLSRLTDHYRPLLALSRALTLGHSVVDIFANSDTPLPSLEFSVPDVFEKFLLRILQRMASSLGLEVKFKEEDSGALLDGLGDTYRRIEPDMVLVREGRPVAVVDAKFKPQYLRTPPGEEIPSDYRVTRDDLYQLFLYQARTRALRRGERPPLAAIIAPQLGLTTPDIDRRRIEYVTGEPGDEPYVLRLLAFPLNAILDHLMNGGGEPECGALAPELSAFVRRAASDGAPGSRGSIEGSGPRDVAAIR
jgi:hypothetical protein